MSIPDEKYFSAIGRFTVAWARLDNSLDTAIAVIQNYHPNIIDKVLPVSLIRKVRFINKAGNKLAVLNSIKNKITEVTSEVTKASGMRHDIIHGAIFHRPQDGLPETQIAILRLFPKGNVFDSKVREFKPTEILHEAATVMNLANKANGMVMSMLDAFGVPRTPVEGRILP